MRIVQYVLTGACLFSCAIAAGQINFHSDNIPRASILTINPRTYQSHDTVWTYSGICKTLMTTVSKSRPLPLPRKTSIPFLTIHGNVQYDFIYRSLVDTPFAQKDFSQHSVQSTLDITVRNSYPVKVIFYSRRSNSPYFDDITDVNIQFKQSMFLSSIREQLKKQAEGLVNFNPLQQLQQRYQQKLAQVNQLKDWLNSPKRLQEFAEEKEANLRRLASSAPKSFPGNIPGLPSGASMKDMIAKKIMHKMGPKIDSLKRLADSLLLPYDSLLQSYQTRLKKPNVSVIGMSLVEKKKELYDSLRKELKSYETKLAGVKKTLQDSLALLKKEISGLRDKASLKAFVAKHKMDARSLPKGWKGLSSIESIGIGRTWVDYSELTVKNISLTGFNGEFSPGKFYLAVAAGKLNYRFRDFIIKERERSRQQLFLLRAGLGSKDGNHFIVSWYDGKRNLLNSFAEPSSVIKPERVIGISAEARLQLDANNFIVLESARSSFHNTGTVNDNGNELAKKIWDFKDRSNEAFSIRAGSYLPATDTRFAGFLRKTGAHFQSFNLQPVNAAQEAYQFKVQQTFWKKRVSIEAGIRKNDFSNPSIYPGVASKTVFKSAQASLRIPKYPFLSIGYFPSSQLTMLSNNIIAENQYNTLSAVASHSYRIKQLAMTSNIVLLKFYNSGADTGFIYYNASSWTINHFMFLQKLQLQSSYTWSSQRELEVHTLEQSLSYQARQWLQLSAGLKYNSVNHKEILWGGTAGLGLKIKGIGQIQGVFERSYLPGTNRNLLPVDMGRLTYIKTF